MVPSEPTVKEDGERVMKKGRNMFYFNFFQQDSMGEAVFFHASEGNGCLQVITGYGHTVYGSCTVQVRGDVYADVYGCN